MSTLLDQRDGGDEFADFCVGVQRLCQVDLTQYKQGQMERRIRTFAEKKGATDLGEYLRLLRADGGELDQFLDRMTINVSQLWRNPEQWLLLGGTLLPELADAGRVRAWSAGCSYGAEAYTLAATAKTAVPRAHVQITGTDIDRRMVARAAQGLFSTDDARSAPPKEIQRWFEATDDGIQAKPELRSMCRFEFGDLLKVRPRPASYDLVLCRNTVIYFKEDVRDELHRRLASAVRPGGYLMVGSTERVSDPRSMGLVTAHPFTYRREQT
jgi:chemotaxis protein methyltransferase CheR